MTANLLLENYVKDIIYMIFPPNDDDDIMSSGSPARYNIISEGPWSGSSHRDKQPSLDALIHCSLQFDNDIVALTHTHTHKKEK